MLIRLTNCHFYQPSTARGNLVHVNGWCYGVADHLFMEPVGTSQCFLHDQASINGGTLGMNSWNDYPWFGTNKFWFIEDSTIAVADQSSATTSGATTDGNFGSRFVVRHNYLISTRVGWHGTEGNGRGVRAVEVYNNTYHWLKTAGYSASFRSGTLLFHDNTFDAGTYNSNTVGGMEAFRANGGGYSNKPDNSFFISFSGTSASCNADGDNPWDLNDADGNLTPTTDGQRGHVFYTGTAAANCTPDPATIFSGSSCTVQVTPALPSSASTWANDGRYTLRMDNSARGYGTIAAPGKPGDAGDGCYPKAGFITAVNTSTNTITVKRYGSGDRGGTLRFFAGDALSVHRVLAIMDSGGRGKGDLITGNNASSIINNATNSKVWPHQVVEPALSWNNVGPSSQSLDIGAADTPTLTAGVDYFNLGINQSSPGGAIPSSYTGPAYNDALNGPGAAYTGTFTYPHPNAGGSLTPAIDSNSHTFTVGASTQTYTVVTENFSPAPTHYGATVGTNVPTGATPNQLPNDVSFSTTTGTFSGSAATAVPGDYKMTLTANNVPGPQSATTATDGFTLTILASSSPPSNVTLTSPTDNQTFSTGSNILLQATAQANGGAHLTDISYYYGGTTLIKSVDPSQVSSPWSYTWPGVADGSYSLTVQATDNNGNVTISTVATPAGQGKSISITVGTSTLAAPNIVVTA
jgi:hypothetical protein